MRCMRIVLVFFDDGSVELLTCALVRDVCVEA